VEEEKEVKSKMNRESGDKDRLPVKKTKGAPG
jgi:hypothetical protein